MHMIAGVLQYVAVASFAEAWIEKNTQDITALRTQVASFAEAWIENVAVEIVAKPAIDVASFAEAWIENYYCHVANKLYNSRLLRGGVD